MGRNCFVQGKERHELVNFAGVNLLNRGIQMKLFANCRFISAIPETVFFWRIYVYFQNLQLRRFVCCQCEIFYRNKTEGIGLKQCIGKMMGVLLPSALKTSVFVNRTFQNAIERIQYFGVKGQILNALEL